MGKLRGKIRGKTRRTTTGSWAQGSECIRAAPRPAGSLLGRLRRWFGKAETTPGTFEIGDRVRITSADPRFADRIGAEVTIASELQRADDGRLYYRLDNNMSAQPECLTLLEPSPQRHGTAVNRT